MTPGEVRACIAVLSRSGRFLPGDHESLRRPEHLFIQPVVFGVASGSLLRPFAQETSGRCIRHALDQPEDPGPSLPRKVEVTRSSSWLFRPLSEPYQLRSANTRDKDLKKHGDLDQQAHPGTTGSETSALIQWTKKSSVPPRYSDRSSRLIGSGCRNRSLSLAIFFTPT
jgi:hypothetical protein